ncbi:MAG: hypothetical protein ACTSSA_13025 [Candidatus Freyarchaeota archaeon]
MVSLLDFYIYSLLFPNIFRFSAIVGVSQEMYAKFYSATIATVIAVILSISLFLRARGQVSDKITILYLAITVSLGTVLTFTISLASYVYIYYPSIFLTETTLLIYRVHMVVAPLLILFLWLLLNQFIKHGKTVNYLVIGACLADTAVNAVSPLTQQEVNGLLSVDLVLIPALILVVLVFSTFSYFTGIFWYYAIKQSGPRRLQSALMGLGGFFGIMSQVANAGSFLLRSSILNLTIWILAALMLIVFYIAILPPKWLLRKTTPANQSEN